MPDSINGQLASIRDIREDILSPETRAAVRLCPEGQYEQRLAGLAQRFADTLVTYAANSLKLRIHKMVLYTGSHLLTAEPRQATYYPADEEVLWPTISRRFTKFTFTQDDEVRHILTEAIWHFKGGHCPAVFLGQDSFDKAQYPILRSVIVPSWELPQADYDEAKAHLSNLPEDYSECNNSQLWDILFRDSSIKDAIYQTKARLRSFLVNPDATGQNRYSEASLKRLFAHVIFEANTRLRQQGVCPPTHRNIFYLPDVRPGPLSGGAVLVFDCSDDTHCPSEESVRALQEAISDYYLAAVSAVESECLVWAPPKTNWTYKTQYFDSPVACHDFVREISESAAPGTISPDIARELRDSVVQVLNALRSDHLLLKGYEQVSARIFAGVCRLWNLLKLEDNVPLVSDADLAMIEKNAVVFETKAVGLPGQGSPFLRLLYKALNFEGHLSAVPSYRDHFIHSFHVFCLGLWCVAQRVLALPDGTRWAFDTLSLKQWFYAAMIHDIGYSLEKIESLADTYIHSMIENAGVRPVVPIHPHWGHLSLLKELRQLFDDDDLQIAVCSQIRNFITSSEVRSQQGDPGSLVPTATDRMLRTVFDTGDHGLVSGLVLYHALLNSDATKDDGTVLAIKPAIFASMTHQCRDWEWSWPGYDNPIAIASPPDGEKAGVRMALCDLPIAHLLVLCDTLSQFGREFPDDDHGERTIRVHAIGEGCIHLVYNGWDFNRIDKYERRRILAKHYRSLRNLLGSADPTLTETAGIKVKLSFREPPQEDVGAEAVTLYPVAGD